MISVNIIYDKLSRYEKPVSIVEIADLISQEDLEGRVVVYRDTLLSYIEEWEEDKNEFSNRVHKDMVQLRSLISDGDTLNECGLSTEVDWYIFD